MPFADLVLVAVAALQQAHRSEVGKNPGQFLNLRYVGLHPEGALLRIHAEGQEVGCRLNGSAGQDLAIAERGLGMVVGDETEELGFFLVGNHLRHHAEVVAEVQGTGRLYAG